MNQTKNIPMNVTPEIAAGHSAHEVQINFNNELFWIDFLSISPVPETVQIISRMIMHPSAVKRFYETLGKMVKDFEEKHGYIPSNNSGLTVVRPT